LVHDLDRVAAHATCAWLPLLPRRVFEEATVHFPGDAAVVGPKQHTRVGTEPELRVLARLDVPGRVELEARLLREADLLRALPVPAEIIRAVHRAAVDEAVRRRVQDAVARIDDRVVHRPAREQRALQLPVLAVVAAEEEHPLPRADG